RQLPDKAVDLLDTASARVKMGQSAKPAQLDDIDHQMENLTIQINAVKRDLDSGISTDTSLLANLEKDLSNLQIEQMELEDRWKKESELVQRINENRKKVAEEKARLRTQGETDSPTVKELGQQLETDKNELKKLQGEDPLIHAEVNGSIAAQVVSDWTGIPAGKMMKDEAEALLNFEKNLKQRIRGQDYAINEIASSLRIAKAGLRNPEAPIGVFLLVGPSGVGKTECARGIADLLFGGERFVITINMSEYQESHTVSQLKGSPPGYVGYGEGGVLTEAVRQRPYSVVILDEVEKAHRDIMNLFYQVFDRGFMRDGEGREIDFKNTVIMMTSNLGSDIMMQMMYSEPEPAPDEKVADEATATDPAATKEEVPPTPPKKAEKAPPKPTPEAMVQAIRPLLIRYFQPALLARFKVVPFLPLDQAAMKEIVRIKLDQVGQRLQTSHHISMEYAGDLVERITSRCTEIETGARNIDFIIDRAILPDVSRALLGQLAEEKVPNRLVLELDEKGDFRYRFV
ncbi:AAA family ATPase, partial [candidate division KSB1 bacterium]|nr:AAA family ATPase [candidate division KSB1 bacterium]